MCQESYLKYIERVSKVNMQLIKLIDEEDILVDSHKLREFNSSKDSLRDKIDRLRIEFIDENAPYQYEKFSSDEVISLIYKFAEKVKQVI